jgi:hypothetical protein
MPSPQHVRMSSTIGLTPRVKKRNLVGAIVDVTDPKDPKLVKTIPGPGNTWTIQMTLHDNIMVTGLEKSSLAWGADPNKPNDEGVLIWDISEFRCVPVDPVFQCES